MDVSLTIAPVWGLALAALAGLSIPAGAALAQVERLLPDWSRTELRHTVTAVGGGALISAVALVLIPEAAERIGAIPLLASFAAGGVAFLMVDRSLARRGTHAAQFVAMMLDYLPEAMALGALVTGRPDVAILTAGIIALQNVPEGFAAWRELHGAAARPRHLALLFCLMVPLGPAAAAVGMFVLAGHPGILGAILAFASGGILYLLFQDVAPAVPLENDAAPPLGAVAGFAIGLAGHLAIA
jgi:ZIP family zinc transporter